MPSQSQTDSGDLLTPDEAAARLGVTRRTVDRLISAGELRSVRGGLRWPSRRVRSADLAEFIRRRTEGEEVAG